MATKSKTKKPATTTRQKPAAKRSAKATPEGRPHDPSAPAVGTTLTRSFKGKDITVKVTAAGFEYDGQTFGSISAVARYITGYMVSGNVFFKRVEPKATTKQEAQP